MYSANTNYLSKIASDCYIFNFLGKRFRRFQSEAFVLEFSGVMGIFRELTFKETSTTTTNFRQRFQLYLGDFRFFFNVLYI